MQAAAGQSAPTNEVGSSETLSGTATMSLVDVGAEKAWNFVTGSASATLSAGSAFQADLDSSGFTVAVRMRVNALPSGAYDQIVDIQASDSSYYGGVSRGGLTNVRGLFYDITNKATTAVSITVTPTPVVFTVVSRISTANASASDYVAIWKDTVGRSGTDPDQITSGVNIGVSPKTMTKIRVNPNDASASANYDILDFIVWGEELSNADAAAVADDIRGQLPLGGAAPTITDAGRAYTGLGTIGQGNGFGYKRF